MRRTINKTVVRVFDAQPNELSFALMGVAAASAVVAVAVVVDVDVPNNPFLVG